MDHDIRNEIELDISSNVARFPDFTGVLITGDIAFAGTKEEYTAGEKWLAKICKILGCPAENVWMTPGNHDVDRSVINDSPTIEAIQNKLRPRDASYIDQEIEKFFKKDKSAKILLFTPMEQFNEFAGKYGCKIDADNPNWSHDHHLNDGSILRLHGINSCLISSEHDDDAENKLVVGTHQVSLTRDDGVAYVTLCHHPPQWIKDQEIMEQYLNQRAVVQLYGHKHKQKVERINDSIRVSSGAMHPDRREPNWEPRYNFITFFISENGDSRTLEVEIFPRVWCKDDLCFKPDFDKKGSEGRFYPIELGGWSKPENPVKAVPGEFSTCDTKPMGGDMPNSSQEKINNPLRRLTFRFLSLPYRTKIDIVQKLDLLQDDDKNMAETEKFRQFYLRATEKKILGKFWDEVENYYEDKSNVNPYLDK